MNASPTGVPPPKARAVDSSPRPAGRFSSGPLAGLTVRVEIDETQQADRGRKFARKDRRPLDPPPVVLCRAYNVIEHGTPDFREVDLPVERAALGLVCHVDLFPVPPLEESDTQPEHTSPSAAILPPMYQLYDATRPVPKAFLPGPAINPYQAPPNQYGLTSDRVGWPPVTTDAQGRLDPDIVAFFGDYPIRESSRCTTMLWGSTFTQAEIIEYNGKRVPMFVYSDLVVKSEGTFILRYRATNVASQMVPAPPFNVLAECYGGPFRVYATKNFPGLLPSTALTKLLSLHHIQVNCRETKRERRKKPTSKSSLEQIGADTESSDESETASPDTGVGPSTRTPYTYLPAPLSHARPSFPLQSSSSSAPGPSPTSSVNAYSPTNAASSMFSPPTSTFTPVVTAGTMQHHPGTGAERRGPGQGLVRVPGHAFRPWQTEGEMPPPPPPLPPPARGHPDEDYT